MTAAPSPPCGQFDALLEAVRQTVGATAVRIPTPEDPLDAHQVDWRKRYRGQALAIVCPANTYEVAEIVRLCGRHRVSIVPQGGNTSLVGGSVPDDSGQQIVLNLQRLNRVLDVDAANLSMTVQAGCLLADVQGAADAAGLLFPLSLASEGSCTIGGNLATNAGGTQVLRYGTARELCLGLEAVTAQGEIWDGLKSLRKDNTGYDLRDLLIGSEGTLAIITAATLRLYPRPTRHQAALVGCDSLAQCVSLLQHTRTRLDARLTGFEVMHQATLALALRHLPEQAQGAGHQRGIGQSADPDHAIKALPYQIHPAVAAAQFQGQARMLGQKFRQPGQQPEAGQAGGHVHPQAPGEPGGIAAEHAVQLLHVGQQIAAALVIRLPILGELDAAGGALEQPHPELGFEALHRPRYARLGQPQAGGRLGEARQLGHPQKNPHCIQLIHAGPAFVGGWIVLETQTV